MTDLEFEAEIAVYKCKRCAHFGHLEIECGLILARPTSRNLWILGTALFSIFGVILGVILGIAIERMRYQ